MKRILALLLSAAMAFSLVACGETNTTGDGGEASSQSSSLKKTKIDLATGGASGTYYAVGGVLKTVLDPKLTLTSLNVQSTGASKANINMITDGDAKMAIVQSDVLAYAHQGINAFEGTGKEDSALWVAGLYNETMQIVAAPGINRIEDIKGKTVCMGDIGSGTRVNAEQILAAYGMTVNDVKAVSGSFQDGVDGIKDGKVDVAFTIAGAPTTAIVELATTNSFNLLSLSDDALKYIEKEFPFLVQENLPANTYNGIDYEVKCVAAQAVLVADKNMSEDAVYEFTKALFDNKAELTQGHAKFANLDPAFAVSGATVKLHPGAQKYYKEVGVL